MVLKTFNQALSNAFALPDLGTKKLKAAFIGLCSDVDRYFRMTFNINIFEEVNEQEFNKIQGVFPNFKKLNLEQFNRLLFTFVNIRDTTAHLFLNKTTYIDGDIEDFIKGIVDTPYALINGKEVTIFGAICIVLLFSQSYQLWSFNTEAIRHNIFVEVSKSGMADYQRDFQKKYDALVGIGKPRRPKEHLFFTKTDITFFIEIIKKTLTKLIFDFEEYASKNQKTSPKVSTIKVLLNKYDCLKDKPELIERISNLRNYWLHGYRLFDQIKSGGVEFDFDFDYLFGVLFDIKSAFIDAPRSREIINDINECGSSMIDFYTLRSLEISYKILDSALFDISKARERIEKSVNAYGRCMTVDPWFYNNAKSLLAGETKTWYLTANKFKDKKERIFEADRIEIFEFSSKDGFDIGENHININEMVLTGINCPIENQLTINGKHLNDYKEKLTDTYGIFDIYSIEL